MKTTEVSFQLPVLGFTTDGEIWGFPDLDRLTKCGPRTLREKMQDGMELIDADGRRWRVRSITRTGRAGGWWTIFSPFGPSQWRIEQDLEPLEPVSLAEAPRWRPSLRTIWTARPQRAGRHARQGEADHHDWRDLSRPQPRHL